MEAYINLFRLFLFIPLILAVLIYQGIGSVQWMHANAANLSPVQEARLEAGKWLQEHGDKNRWVLSGDIGAIGYAAKDFKFIDTFGLCSKDLLTEYQNGDSIDLILASKDPLYIADTFNVIDGKLAYTHLDGAFFKHGKQSIFLYRKIVKFEKLYSWRNRPYAIGIARIK